MFESPPYDARSIANFVLDRAASQSIGISNLHIHKILYFAHGSFLLQRNRQLIAQHFEAWEYGPVIQDLYHQFKKFDRSAILERATRLNVLTAQYEIAQYQLEDKDAELLTELVDYFIRIPAEMLSEWSHAKDGPWYEAWHYEGKSNPGMKINNRAIAQWFATTQARERKV